MARKIQTFTFNCKYCNSEKSVFSRAAKAPIFCGSRCSNLWQYANGRIPSASYEARELREGIETVAAFKESLIHHFKCEFCDKSVAKRKRNPLPRFCNQQCAQSHAAIHRKNGWSLEQRRAVGERMKNRMSEHPESCYSFGIKGWYKGKFFRSSYEYFFMKHLEAQGIHIDEIECEPFAISFIFHGEEKTYYPDFFVKKFNCVFEVKNSFSKNDEIALAKAEAAQKWASSQGINYKLMTENDISVPPNVRSALSQDPCVFLVPKNQEDDRWEAMFQQQEAFMKLLQEKRDFPTFPLDLRKKDHQKIVKDISHDCMHELFEAVHLLKNSKAHRVTEFPEFDRESFLEELADVSHYLIEIFILLGMSPKDVFYAYMKKGTINAARITGDY